MVPKHYPSFTNYIFSQILVPVLCLTKHTPSTISCLTTYLSMFIPVIDPKNLNMNEIYANLCVVQYSLA